MTLVPVAARRWRWLVGWAVALISAVPAGADTCRQALALGLDVSGSVDSREYRMQLDGLAGALRDPDVVRALLSVPAANVRLAVYEWSGPDYQRLLLDWTEITGADVVDDVARRLTSAARSPAPPETALGTAMQFGAALLAAHPECWKRTIDISGDGRHNAGPHPRDVRNGLRRLGFTLNGLVIGPDDGGAALAAYFRAWVIFGPEAFVETALGFEDYRAAMTRKLLRELEVPAVSALSPDPATPHR